MRAGTKAHTLNISSMVDNVQMETRKTSFTRRIVNEFDSHETLTISELYEILSKTTYDIPKNVLRHRVRSSIDSLLRKGTVIRVAPATYRKSTHD